VLDQAGWVLPQGATIRQRDGVALAGELFVRADDERRVLAARRIAEIAASIGAQITVQAADFETVIKERYVSPYAFDMLLGSWVQGAGDPNFADVVFYDPDDFALFHSSQVIQGPNDTRTTRNFVGFSDPEYDAQAQAGRQLYIIEERIAAYQQTQARIASQVPYVFLWADRIPLALSQRVSTLDGPVELTSPLYFWNIERWYLNS
jgi:peptide/nickel transport system substrate-binding protein